MNHLHVAVLRGGPSEEYSVSMNTGTTVLQALTEAGYSTKDVIITRQGDWLDKGIVRSPENILKAVDVVFVALHGTYGEDGEVQKVIQRLGLPFTGSRSFASALAFNKHHTKERLRSHGVRMPEHLEIKRDDEVDLGELSRKIHDSFGPEYILKPVASGSSYGVEFISEGQSLEDAIEKAFDSYDKLIIEEFIRGKEATCAILENFRNEKIYVFPSIEIIPPRDRQFFTTDSKYDGRSSEICPARFSYSERQQISDVSALVHEVLDLSQYSRSDFIVAGDEVYFLEVNTLPGLTKESLYPKAAASVGLNMKDLIAHLVETATG
jgi:D-alanine-D-alanine ligase